MCIFPLFSCPPLSSKLDYPVIKILERHSLKLKKSALQATEQRCIHIEITCYKISALGKIETAIQVVQLSRTLNNSNNTLDRFGQC